MVTKNTDVWEVGRLLTFRVCKHLYLAFLKKKMRKFCGDTDQKLQILSALFIGSPCE